MVIWEQFEDRGIKYSVYDCFNSDKSKYYGYVIHTFPKNKWRASSSKGVFENFSSLLTAQKWIENQYNQ